MIKIFISHSSRDKESAAALAELFRNSLKLSKSEIRCTSVDGYRLPAGVNTDEQLRREVLEAPAMVGVVSHQSFESAYVLFELGARWGKNAFLVPVLAPGVSASVLKGPLSSLNALSCDSASQMHQLVSDFAAQLDLPLESPSSYHEYIDAILKIPPKDKVAHPTEIHAENDKVTTISGIKDTDEYSNAEQIIKKKCEEEWPDDYQMRAYCEEKQRAAVERLRSEKGQGIPVEVFNRIRRKAALEWPRDYQMRVYTEEKQIQSYRKLHEKN